MKKSKGYVNRKGALYSRLAGFTLIEIICALAVIGVATSIFISLFYSSQFVAQWARYRKVAAGLAQERMNDVLRSPEKYTWPDSAALSTGALAPVYPAGQSSDSELFIKAPSVMPVADREYERESAFYERYRWSAYVHQPNPEAKYNEIVIAVRWRVGERNEMLTLTSAIAKSDSGGKS